MRIDRIEIRNFKKFSNYTLDLHPQFTPLVGDNGTGKTSFEDYLEIRGALIQTFTSTAPTCFNPDGKPLNRPGDEI